MAEAMQPLCRSCKKYFVSLVVSPAFSDLACSSPHSSVFHSGIWFLQPNQPSCKDRKGLQIWILQTLLVLLLYAKYSSPPALIHNIPNYTIMWPRTWHYKIYVNNYVFLLEISLQTRPFTTSVFVRARM